MSFAKSGTSGYCCYRCGCEKSDGVRVMTLRAFAAGILAFGIGAIPSSDSWAAPGGHFAAAPAFAARGAPIARSPLMAHPRMNDGFHFRVGAMHGFRFSRFRDRLAPGFPFWWGYAAAGPYDDPADYVQT